MFVSFFEEPATILARARRMSLDLQPWVDSGVLDIAFQPISEMESDELTDRILDQAARMGARRLVIDGLGVLELSSPRWWRASGTGRCRRTTARKRSCSCAPRHRIW